MFFNKGVSFDGRKQVWIFGVSHRQMRKYGVENPYLKITEVVKQKKLTDEIMENFEKSTEKIDRKNNAFISEDSHAYKN